MDLVPHWDYGFHFRKKFWCFVIAGAEPIIGIAVFVWIVLSGNFSQATIINMFVGGLFCLLPDVMGLFIRLFKLKLLKPIALFHAKLHWFVNFGGKDIFDFGEIKISPRGIVLGVIYQVPFLLVSLWFLMR